VRWPACGGVLAAVPFPAAWATPVAFAGIAALRSGAEPAYSSRRDGIGHSVSGWDEATDELLLLGLARADERALGTLYDRYGSRARGLAYRVLGERGAAEEVVQEAFLGIWRRAESFTPGRGSAERWILAIVHHRAIDRLRAGAGRAGAEIPLDLCDRVLAVDDPWPEVEQLLRRDALRHWLATLPDDQRRILELAYFAGYSQREIVALTGVPLGTVKARTRLAFKKLRALPDMLLAQERYGDAAPPPEASASAAERPR